MKLSFLELPPDERSLYIEQAAVRRNVSPVILEKDFWVCWLLGILFQSEFAGRRRTPGLMRRRLLALTGPILVSLFASACDSPVGSADEGGVPRDGQPASFDEIVADTQSLAVRLELKHSLRIRNESPLSSYLGRRILSDRGPWVLAEFTYTQSGEHAFVLVRREKAGDGFLVATNYRPQKLGPDGNDVDSGKWDEDFVYEYDVSLVSQATAERARCRGPQGPAATDLVRR